MEVFSSLLSVTRGVRRPITVQLADIDNQIASLQMRRKDSLETQEQEYVKELLDAAKAAGKTPLELVSMLTQHNAT